MYDRRPWYIETLKIELRKLLRNSNGYNFSLGCLITRIIYRDPRNWTWKLLWNSNNHNFWLKCMIDADYISRRSKLNNRRSQEIQMAITFHWDVRSRASYIETLKIEHGISRHIQTAITFDYNVWSKLIIYRDDPNWTVEALEKFKCI